MTAFGAEMVEAEVSEGEKRWGVNGWSRCLSSQDPNNWKSPGGENRWGVNGWSRCFLSQDPNNWKSLGAKIDGA